MRTVAPFLLAVVELTIAVGAYKLALYAVRRLWPDPRDRDRA